MGKRLECRVYKKLVVILERDNATTKHSNLKQLMIQENIDILDYAVYWRTKSETGFIGELFHIIRNSSGGSLRTPVGYLVGFVEPASEYYASYWKIILNTRKEIRYNLEDNTTYVFVKSAYASKLKYHCRLAQAIGLAQALA